MVMFIVEKFYLYIYNIYINNIHSMLKNNPDFWGENNCQNCQNCQIFDFS